jgi:hypothetical protein
MRYLVLATDYDGTLAAQGQCVLSVNTSDPKTRDDANKAADSSESSQTKRTDMNIRFIVGWMLLLGTFQLNAQDWSSWAATNNRDFQYRWLGSASNNRGECYLQLHDLKRQPNETTFVSVLVDYQSGQA